MKIKTRIRLNLFLIKAKNYIYLFLWGILIIFLFIFLEDKINFNEIISNSNISGLLGVLLGSAISLYGTFKSSTNQLKIKGIVVRKNVIYSPLYDEIKKFTAKLRQLKEDENYPRKFIFNQAEMVKRNMFNDTPYFTAWDRINGDVRGIEVPRYFNKYFNELLNKAENYQSAVTNGIKEVHSNLISLFESEGMEDIVKRINVNNIHGEILSQITKSNENESNDQDPFRIFFNDKEIKNIMAPKVKQLIEESKRIESVVDIKIKYEELINYSEELSEGIELVIHFIQKRYENKSLLI
ncbi:hypothetical protein RS399_21795 [Bacillus inaquosorum]|uniref:hypothetical protein n=1 Tax=Bacillus inaquosorum TaxID=483913 RepID=UPI000A120DCE|nr:hypothetical protein [Bacillus inaquosorum]QJC88906.1 hypothetical protein HC662_20710 [Bacillus subtilis]WNW24274.1 hypothetical protein RS399_21795 [Bacillus inaquosorum]